MRSHSDTHSRSHRGAPPSVLDVLVVGAGPVGLTAAAELRRRGVTVRIVDRLPARLPYAKAVGVQPRTLEIWERMGCVRAALEAAVPLRGQFVYVDGVERARTDLVLPAEVPYRFAALPQYETERILAETLARFGTRVERVTELVGFTQDADGVTARLVRAVAGGTPAEEEVRCRYLVGCDGAHSAVRKGLGLAFEGGAFPSAYMLGDVRLDWDVTPGYSVRASRTDRPGGAADRTGGSSPGAGGGETLVAVPLPGGRYRVSMNVPSGGPDEPAGPPERGGRADEGTEGADGVTHGLEHGGRKPWLSDLQGVLDRLSPWPVTASDLRWSSVFRISHRLVDRYGEGRVFVAGDAAHIHPPTGAQGMNTGIQDAYNLAWKLALAVEGRAAPGLLASYDAERHPVGQEVVGRTVRHAVQGMEADPADPETLMLREAQLLLGYRGSPVVGGAGPSADGEGPGPRAGDRVPDCTGLTHPLVAAPLRLHELLRDRGHVLLLHPEGDGPAAAGELRRLADRAAELSGGAVETCVVLPGAAPEEVSIAVAAVGLAVYRDAAGGFARGFAVPTPTAFLVRPDGYLGARFDPADRAALDACLRGVFAP
ncbi:FAD-dependent monooxygenase [Streptomyces sp. NPDC090025]|uniref:FAD-dependent monooxygenase n=1 Tax=Streptomyces sp. NPDC090025 TaxID=3365922 RepID=UPI003832E5A8